MVAYRRPTEAGVDPVRSLQKCIDDARQRNLVSILIESPTDLGDDHAQIVQSLNALAAADLSLMIVPPNHRPKRDPHAA